MLTIVLLHKEEVMDKYAELLAGLEGDVLEQAILYFSEKELQSYDYEG